MPRREARIAENTMNGCKEVAQQLGLRIVGALMMMNSSGLSEEEERRALTVEG